MLITLISFIFITILMNWITSTTSHTLIYNFINQVRMILIALLIFFRIIESKFLKIILCCISRHWAYHWKLAIRVILKTKTGCSCCTRFYCFYFLYDILRLNLSRFISFYCNILLLLTFLIIWTRPLSLS